MNLFARFLYPNHLNGFIMNSMAGTGFKKRYAKFRNLSLGIVVTGRIAAVMYGKLDRIIFWKLAHWLARKYRTSIKSLMRQWVRHAANGKAKSWLLFGRSGRGNLCGVALRRLVTSRKAQFRWRNLEINPYVTRSEQRNTVTSRYHDVAMAMSHA